MNRDELIKRIQESNPERVKIYLEVLDRLLLQCLVAHLMEGQEVEAIIKHWEEQVKMEINLESGARSDFLMGTAMGRVMSSVDKVEDGEALRLSSIKAMEVAKEIAKRNFIDNSETT